MSWCASTEDPLNESGPADTVADTSNESESVDHLNQSEHGINASESQFGQGFQQDLETTFGEINESYFAYRTSPPDHSPSRLTSRMSSPPSSEQLQ